MISRVFQATATHTQQELWDGERVGRTGKVTSYITQLRKYQKSYTLGTIAEWAQRTDMLQF